MILNATVLAVLGHLVAIRRDYAGASKLLDEGRAMLRELREDDLTGYDRLQHLLTIAFVDNFLGQVRLSQGDNDAAARLFTDGLAVARRAQDGIPILISLYDLALSSQAQGDLAGAAGHLKEGLAMTAEAGDETSAAYYLRPWRPSPASRTTHSVPCACSPPHARNWKPAAAAGRTPTCHAPRTTMPSWPRCAPA